MGLTPQRAANAADECSRSGLSPAATERRARCPGRSREGDSGAADNFDQLGCLGAQRLVVCCQGQPLADQYPYGCLGSCGDIGGVVAGLIFGGAITRLRVLRCCRSMRIASDAATIRWLICAADPPHLAADRLGSHAQDSQGLHGPVAGLGDHSGVTGEHGTSGRFACDRYAAARRRSSFSCSSSRIRFFAARNSALSLRSVRA